MSNRLFHSRLGESTLACTTSNYHLYLHPTCSDMFPEAHHPPLGDSFDIMPLFTQQCLIPGQWMASVYIGRKGEPRMFNTQKILQAFWCTPPPPHKSMVWIKVTRRCIHLWSHWKDGACWWIAFQIVLIWTTRPCLFMFELSLSLVCLSIWLHFHWSYDLLSNWTLS